MKHGYIKVCAATPKIAVGDVPYNTGSILSAVGEARRQRANLLVLPELCLTGSTCGDLFFQAPLLDAALGALARIKTALDDSMVVVLGLPLRAGGGVINAAAVLQSGRLLGIVPRGTADGRYFIENCPDTLVVDGEAVPAGGDLLFSMADLPEFTFAVEVGGDFTLPAPPSVRHAVAGAALIACPWAEPATAGSRDRLHRAVAEHGARLSAGYVLAAAGEGESTGEGVCLGESVICEGRTVLARGEDTWGLLTGELDVQHLLHRRQGLPGFAANPSSHRTIPFSQPLWETELTRAVSPAPFLPGADRREKRLGEILRMQALGLKKRMDCSGAMKLVIGLSGGLDSTLAALAAARALDLMDRPRSDLIAVTMPCFGTTERTLGSAELLAEGLGAQLRIVDIRDCVNQHFDDIGHARDNHNTVYENAQARERTQVLMDIANQVEGLVVGTGDMSELALGWCTFGGDQLAMYGVNASIPKTLARELVAYARDTAEDETLVLVLDDILDTPVSPELLPPEDGVISQETEQLIGPYALHDFFIYYALGRGFSPTKILRLAERAFAGRYNRIELVRWMGVFYRRVLSGQFKRASMPEGPSVGEISLSPRDGLRLPGDAVARLWLDEVDKLR